MEVGMVIVMQGFGYEGLSDAGVYEQELELALLAEAQGLDHIWVVEHHFEDYAFCPDNFMYLAYLAARTKKIRLATGAVILPWHAQPLRVAEKAAMLDNLCDGRLIFGLGRGLSRFEFEGFGIEMGESRERFDEAAPMVLDALETGWMAEHEGKFFRQKRVPLRPPPTRSFVGRRFQVAMSPDSAEQAAKLGLPIMAFSIKPREVEKAEFEEYRKHFHAYNDGAEPPPPFLADLMICDSDADRARDNAQRYCAGYLQSVLRHYELMSDHFEKVGGYDTYGQNAQALREIGLDDYVKNYVNLQSWGTPDQMLRRFEERRALFGEFGIQGIFRFAGLPMEDARRSLELFGKEVLPVLRTWGNANA
ncbi:MAG: LLM class flavin-dependent oxidoreductase [Myxococcota bacterium]